MPSDEAQAEGHRDPRDGTAAIPPVTDAMMDHAAHEAAALADGVAHGTVAVDAPSAGTPAVDAMPSVMAFGAEPVTGAADRAAQVVADPAGDAVAATGPAMGEARDAAEAARDAPSALADALTRYNVELFELMRANAASTTALFAALVQTKSVPEALSLNAEHLRRQVETLTSQGRELATLAQRIVLDAWGPFKGPTGR